MHSVSVMNVRSHTRFTVLFTKLKDATKWVVSRFVKRTICAVVITPFSCWQLVLLGVGTVVAAMFCFTLICIVHDVLNPVTDFLVKCTSAGDA